MGTLSNPVHPDMEQGLLSAQRLLAQYNQVHLLDFWNKLSAGEQSKLLLQIEATDFALVQSLYQD